MEKVLLKLISFARKDPHSVITILGLIVAMGLVASLLMIIPKL